MNQKATDHLKIADMYWKGAVQEMNADLQRVALDYCFEQAIKAGKKPLDYVVGKVKDSITA